MHQWLGWRRGSWYDERHMSCWRAQWGGETAAAAAQQQGKKEAEDGKGPKDSALAWDQGRPQQSDQKDVQAHAAASRPLASPEHRKHQPWEYGPARTRQVALLKAKIFPLLRHPSPNYKRQNFCFLFSCHITNILCSYDHNSFGQQ